MNAYTNAQDPPPPVQAVLVSVGGAPAPILCMLRHHQPGHAWYFCSEGSRKNAEDIQAQLAWHPHCDFIEVARFEELGPCYQELRRRIPELLKKWRMDAAGVLVDYTGGTKTMSAALVLAATEIFGRFSYVGGEQREKGGLGITIDGREKFIYQGNPWSGLAVREVERARDLWAGCQLDAAGQILRQTALKVPHRHRFEAVADLAAALAARHRLDFRSANTLVRPLASRLRLIFDGQPDHGLIAYAQKAQALCQALWKTSSGDKAGPELLRELLDNTLRTAAQGRFEDAAARLYRAAEMQLQIWLAEATGGAFLNGVLQRRAAPPGLLDKLTLPKADHEGMVKLGLRDINRALEELDYAPARTMAADVRLGPKSQWNRVAQWRNQGILAHGVAPVGQPQLAEMKQVAAGLLGFQLDREEHPFPPLDHRWLVDSGD